MIAEQTVEPVDDKAVAAIKALLPAVVERAPREAVKMLEPYPPEFVAQMLELLNASIAQDVLACFPSDFRQKIMVAAPPEVHRQWMRNERYPEGTIGHMMEPPLALYSPETTIAEATAHLRHLAKRAFITYLWVVDEEERLLGVVVMREMLLSEDTTQRLDEIMIRDAYYLTPEMSLTEAMKETVIRHFPVYPVCDAERRLIGLVRGRMLFEAQAFELSAQVGTMVGVEKEERLSTPWLTSLKARHPWLQLNLFTAFIAAAVVGTFEETINHTVALAVFLPVLAGQSVTTGCQALAVALRGLTLGELNSLKSQKLVVKEAMLGLVNGTLVGLTAGLGMFLYANLHKNPAALKLGLVVFLAMVGSCIVSGIAGATIPLVLKRFGTDPATASSIFLTTITDIVSMGAFLGLATALI